MSIVQRYEERIFNLYMSTRPNVDPDEVRHLIHEFTERQLRDIPCVLHNNMTHERIQTSMINTFDWIEQRNPIISGNGAFFMQHSEQLAPTVKMLEKLQANRKAKKNEMYQYDKESIEYVNANIQQLSIKVIMNADFGGSGTPLSPFYSCYIPPATTGSAKNITTSLICCLEFFSGNNDAWAKLNSINELFDMIFSVLEDPRTDREYILDSFTVEEVFKWLLSRTNNITNNDKKTLYAYLKTLKPNELTKLMFAFNPRLVLKNYVYGEMTKISDYLKQNQIDINNITKESIHNSGYGVKPPEAIVDAINRVNKLIVDNCVYPFIPNDAEIRADNMKRIIVCVTDTDSLMVHFASFIDDFQANVGNFRDSCLIASAFGMRMVVENVIPQFVEYIATFCNINDKYYRDKFVFKNEFAFLSMALLAKKMYAASMFVQEGKPRNPHAIAFTGLSFKKRDTAEFLEPIMTELYDKYILTGNQVSIGAVLDTFYSLRIKLINSIGTDPSYYKVLSIKDIGAYDPNKVLPEQMRGAIVWNAMMPDEEMLPMDRVRVIPLSFAKLHEYASTNPKINEVLRLSLIDNKDEKHDPYICIPEHYHDIPDWIKPTIDIEYATDKLLLPFKQTFEAFGVYLADTRAGCMPSRMGYI